MVVSCRNEKTMQLELDSAEQRKHEPRMLIYKVFRKAELEAFERDGVTAGAPVDIADGFIHFSTAEQLPGTLAKHFADEDDLTLLALDDAHLDPLKWEVSRGGALFPHLYRALRREDVIWSRALALGPNGHIIGDL